MSDGSCIGGVRALSERTKTGSLYSLTGGGDAGN